MTAPLSWERDGHDWPHRTASRFINAGGTTWHVQIMGSGPALVLLHGTGASTHSWRTLAPLLARRHTVVAPDLPGHGFTPRLAGPHTLPAMSASLAALLASLGVEPLHAVGHSAGAAIAIRLVLDGRISPLGIVSLNGALVAWRGLPALVFAPLARLLAGYSFVPQLFARRTADAAVLTRLVNSTGSNLDADSVGWYRLLASNPAHVAGALAMMASWDLQSLEHDLPSLRTPLLFIHGARDRMVPTQEVDRIAALIPGMQTINLPNLGHLAHEEDAPACDRAMEAFERRCAPRPSCEPKRTPVPLTRRR